MSQTKAQLLDGKSATIQYTAGSASAPAISFTSDTNTGIYSPGADQVAISTNGTGRLFVDNNGYIGFGTSSFTAGAAGRQVVEANGSSSVLINLDAGGTRRAYIYSDSTDTVFYNTQAGPLILGTSNTERLRITSDGKVGLGSSSPTSALTVAGDVAVGGTGNIGVRFHSASPTAASLRWLLANDQGNSDKLTLYRYDSGGNFAAQVLTVDTSNRVGVGTTPVNKLDVNGSVSASGSFSNTGYAPAVHIGLSSGNPTICSGNNVASTYLPLVFTRDTTTGSAESMRLDASGRLLAGTSSARSTVSAGTATPSIQLEGTNFSTSVVSVVRNESGGSGAALVLGRSNGTTAGSNTSISDGNGIGFLSFQGADGTNLIEAARISAFADGGVSTNDMPGRLVFSTTADGASSPTERVRINSSGDILVDGSAVPSAGAGAYIALRGGDNTCISTRRAGTANREHIAFFNGNGQVGTISSSGTTTAYNTSSDYRLKENVTAVTDGITRLQQLKPSRFNFIADLDKTVDGFLAHEVQAVVPEAITGEKDAVDDDGNPVYQGIDQSKLVPLLTAALQEAVARIEQLEAAVATLQGS